MRVYKKYNWETEIIDQHNMCAINLQFLKVLFYLQSFCQSNMPLSFNFFQIFFQKHLKNCWLLKHVDQKTIVSDVAMEYFLRGLNETFTTFEYHTALHLLFVAGISSWIQLL